MSGQSEFRAALLDADRPVPDGLIDGSGAPAGRRYAVYRNNVAVSLGESLTTGFPVLTKLLGEENFKQLAAIHLRQHPPQSPLMMHYGSDMPAFLEGFEPLQHLGYLPDVARLELALRRAYHAADAAPIAAEALQIAPEALMAARLRLAPSVQLIRSRWPIYGLWTYNMIEGADAPENRGENVIVTRPDFTPEPHLLPAGGGVFIAALQDNETFAAAHAKATEAVADFDLGAILALLLGGEAIVEVIHEGQP